MRTRMLLLIVAAFVGGCSVFNEPRPPPSLSAPGPCGIQARQRLNDAIMFGQADGYEQLIFNHAYQDCIAAAKRFGEQ